MKKTSRRVFLAASVKAALFSAYASGSPIMSGPTPWSNWSGGQTCRPAGRHDITDEDELRKILRSSSGQIRPVGSSHSFSPLVPTDGHLIVVDQLNQIRSYDQKAMTVTLGAGARLGDLGAQLDAIGQGMINLPDIDRQTIAGAMATGTHGTGVTLPALSSMIVGLRLVTPNGNVLNIDTSPTGEVTFPVKYILNTSPVSISPPFCSILPRFTLPLVSEAKLVTVLPVLNTASSKVSTVLS